MKTFKEDLQLFITFLQNNDNPDEIRKEYRRMVKLYHPDIAPENQKQIYNDYILLINKVYSDGKTRAKETVIDTDKKSENREYISTIMTICLKLPVTNMIQVMLFCIFTI